MRLLLGQSMHLCFTSWLKINSFKASLLELPEPFKNLTEWEDYHYSKVKVHLKRTYCEGRIFHCIRAGHKIDDWLQHSTVQVPAANAEETSPSEDTADGSEWLHYYWIVSFLQHFQTHLAALIFHQLLWFSLREIQCCNKALRLWVTLSKSNFVSFSELSVIPLQSRLTDERSFLKGL